jgi:hypothetical protein
MGDLYLLRDRSLPLEKWRCCSTWQRCLLNKWNSREFAAMHGVAVPDLYWYGRDLRRFPVDSLPPRFAVRRAWGAASEQTHLLADGWELIDQKVCTAKQLYMHLRSKYGWFTVWPLLVEELLEDASDHQRATQFNFYSFSGHIGLIEHVRHSGRVSQRNAYTPQWRPFAEGVYMHRPCGKTIERPPEMDAMMAMASRLGSAFGGFARIDLYLSRKGIYFGEFSSAPFGGLDISDWADKLLGRLWDDFCADAI